MGFSGGGSNVLLPHTHDGTVAQDGGPLNFNNITQSQSAAGEVFYSDGIHLQQLAYPAVPAGETLTAAAASTAPSWVAAGGGAVVEKIAEIVQPADNPTMTLSFAAVTNSTVAKYYGVCSGGFTTSGLNSINMTLNGMVTNYNVWRVFHDSAGAITSAASTGGANMQIIRNPYSNRFTIFFEITMNPISENLQLAASATTQAPEVQTVWATNTTAATTTLSEIEFTQSNGAGDILAGTICSLYKVNL
jgi:hypothetical protein